MSEITRTLQESPTPPAIGCGPNAGGAFSQVYSDDDRYRGVKNLRTLIFMNRDDMQERGLEKYDLVDITSFAKDGSTRGARGYRALPYDHPRGSAMGYMPELNVLCPIGDYSPQSDPPLMKHVVIEITPSRAAR